MHTKSTFKETSKTEEGICVPDSYLFEGKCHSSEAASDISVAKFPSLSSVFSSLYHHGWLLDKPINFLW